jgi:hypothetical protein
VFSCSYVILGSTAAQQWKLFDLTVENNGFKQWNPLLRKNWFQQREKNHAGGRTDGQTDMVTT